jgi:hypothetical protein
MWEGNGVASKHRWVRGGCSGDGIGGRMESDGIGGQISTFDIALFDSAHPFVDLLIETASRMRAKAEFSQNCRPFAAPQRSNCQIACSRILSEFRRDPTFPPLFPLFTLRVISLMAEEFDLLKA